MGNSLCRNTKIHTISEKNDYINCQPCKLCYIGIYDEQHIGYSKCLYKYFSLLNE